MTSNGPEVFRRLQAMARSAAAKAGTGAPTQEYLVRHVLESFLDRLTRTRHEEHFVLKGGVLLGAYGARRPTKDIDAEVINESLTVETLYTIVRDLAAVETQDGVNFDPESITVQEIRDRAEYPAMRLRIAASIGPWRTAAVWDVSTGDPVVPPPRLVTIERVLGEPIRILGYAPETAIAEKGVTILERGITSTRWRDFVDIVQLASRGIDEDSLVQAAQAVARYRGVSLEATAPHLVGYGDVAQAKWAAWRRKEGLEAVCAELLDDQVEQVAAVLDPVFTVGSGPNL